MNSEVKIQVLGSGCPTCKKLFELTRQAIAELHLNVEAEYITDIQKIVELGVMSSPVLVISGKPVISGFLPKIAEIKEAITANVAVTSREGDTCCSDNNFCDIDCRPKDNTDSHCSCDGNC